MAVSSFDSNRELSNGVERLSSYPGRFPHVRPLFLLCCILFIAVRLPFIFTVPMVEAPDEYAHYWVAKFLFEFHRLPAASEVAAGGPSAVYGSLPQFGYIPHIAIASLFPSHEFALFARFGSLAMGLLLLWCAYAIGRELFPRQRLLSAAMPFAVIFHPQLAFVNSYINNDSTSSALASLVFLLAIRSLRTGITMRLSAAIGLLTGWLAITKYSGLGIMPPVALCLIASAVINKTPSVRTVYNLATCGALAAGVCAWWFVRNATEFHGDFLGTKTMYFSWAMTFHRPLTYYLPASHIIKSIRWWRMMFFSFWGMFGYMNKYMFRPVYFVYLGYLITGALGFLIFYGRSIKQWLSARNLAKSVAIVADADEYTARVDYVQLAAWSAVILAVVLNLTSMIWASTTNLGGPQGRYMFTSELPVIALLVAGLNHFSARYGNKLVISFLVFNALTCAGAWIWLFRLYGFHAHPL